MNVHLNGLGLRSGTSADDLGGASYAMAYGKAFTVPDDFDELLENTIDQILGFDGSDSRTLLIVSGVYPTGEQYGGGSPTFPKCSSKPKSTFASTDIGSNGSASLVSWVLDQLPK